MDTVETEVQAQKRKVGRPPKAEKSKTLTLHLPESSCQAIKDFVLKSGELKYGYIQDFVRSAVAERLK